MNNGLKVTLVSPTMRHHFHFIQTFENSSVYFLLFKVQPKRRKVTSAALSPKTSARLESNIQSLVHSVGSLQKDFPFQPLRVFSTLFFEGIQRSDNLNANRLLRVE